ncbi:TonB family protein [Arenimonas sp. MALMAid1274]|uniref:serine/threonine protein kinase n=1 Tax=Arenimonas sp. MALMAid1274 TaxID=3411630 RepID=UPI003BA0AA25
MRSSIQIGETIGPFVIVAKLGRGGMSTVYNAYETGLDREVALKVLPIDLLEEPGFTERFEREARLIAKLEHPHIVPLYSYGIDDGVPWMALRLVRGGHLGERMEREPLGRDVGLAYFTMIADALDHAHSLGVVHRDLKPQNVLLGERGELYLADFGISRLLQGRTTITSTGAVLGTPQYMSPEQAQGDQIGPGTDVYSVGIMVYQWLTGSLPFDADTPYAVMYKHVNAPLALDRLSALPERAVQVIARALSKKPEERWATAGQFIEKLVVALDGEAAEGGRAAPRFASPVAAAISARRLEKVPSPPTSLQGPARLDGSEPAPAEGAAKTPVPPTSIRLRALAANAAYNAAKAASAANPPAPAAPGDDAPPPPRAATPAKGSTPPPRARTPMVAIEDPGVDPAAATQVGPSLQFRPRSAPPAPANRRPMMFAAGAAVLVVLALAWFLLGRSPEGAQDAGTAAAVDPVAAPVAPATPPPLPVGDARLLIESDADCSLALDGIDRGVLKPMATQRLELAPGTYAVSCTSLARPDVKLEQAVTVTLDEPSVVLFEVKAKIDMLDQLRTAEQERLAEEARRKAESVRMEEEREAADAQARADEARKREADRLAAETRKLEEARAAALARREQEIRKLEEARAAAAARAAPARPVATAPAATPADPRAAEQARIAETRRREALEAARQQREARLAERKAAADVEAARLAAEQANAQAAAQALAAQAAAAPPRRLTPIAVSTPQPNYPVGALRGGITGTVEVQITIARDGSVSNVRILSARPRGTFERSVQSTVRNWRFEPLDETVTITRTINFR